MKRIGLLACVGTVLFVGAAHAQNDELQTKTFRVKNVRSGIVAWWLDPASNKEPLEITASNKASESRRVSSEAGSTPNPYVNLENPYQSSAPKKLVVPREAPAGSTLEMFALPQGVTHVFNLASQNVLLAYGTPAGFAELEKTIAFLDQPIPQVEIEVQYFSLSDETAKSLIALFPNAKSETVKTARVFQNIDSAAVEARLKELQEQKKVRLINGPRVTVMNNMTSGLGSVHVGPAVLGIRNPQGEIKAIFEEQDEWYSSKLMAGVSTDFIVSPTIQNDDTITIDFNPRTTLVVHAVKDSAAPMFMGNRDSVALKTLNSIQILANIKDGQMIAVTQTAESFFPLPQLIGQPTPKDNAESQVMIFVKARIVRRNDERVAIKTKN